MGDYVKMTIIVRSYNGHLLKACSDAYNSAIVKFYLIDISQFTFRYAICLEVFHLSPALTLKWPQQPIASRFNLVNEFRNILGLWITISYRLPGANVETEFMASLNHIYKRNRGQRLLSSGQKLLKMLAVTSKGLTLLWRKWLMGNMLAYRPRFLILEKQIFKWTNLICTTLDGCHSYKFRQQDKHIGITFLQFYWLIWEFQYISIIIEEQQVTVPLQELNQ
ncbi:hypothetical protein HAX54_011590 [Datura stramonium]|uniref:Uncharacterized protein n=1 Tax=Datura stramonium TaxID=4076 RepID=A0ABS8TK51_DATST|nr:hypothetical protein [Datura stramonium]